MAQILTPYSTPYQTRNDAPWSAGSSSGSPFGNLSAVKNLFNPSSNNSNSIFGGVTGGIKNSINQAGTNLGFAPSATYYNAAGALPWQTAGGVANPAAAGMSGVNSGGTTLTGSLGYGSLGSLGANLLGLGSGNMIVDSGLGAVGSLAGGALGANMGTILGMAGGPVGAVLGGFAGTALGGMFGRKKPKAKVSIFANANDAEGNLGNPYVRGKTIGDEYGNGVFNSVSPYLSEFAKELGPLKTMNVVGGTHSKWGGDFLAAVPPEFANQENVPKEFLRNYNAQQEGGMQNAVNQLLTDMGTYSGYSPEQINAALQRIKKKETLGTLGSGASGAINIPTANAQQNTFAKFLENYKNTGATLPDNSTGQQ